MSRQDRKAAARPSFFSAQALAGVGLRATGRPGIEPSGPLAAWRASQLSPRPLLMAAALLLGAGGACAQSCSFKTPPSGVIDFGAPLDQSIGNTRTAWADTEIQCTGSAKTPIWTITGSNGSNPFRLKHATSTATISYTVNESYVRGGVGNQLWRVTATILGAAYQNVPPGSYADALIITIAP